MSKLGYSQEAKKARIGYATVICMAGTEFSIIAQSKAKLEEAFNHLTGGMVYFNPEKVNRVRITKEKS